MESRGLQVYIYIVQYKKQKDLLGTFNIEMET